VRAAFDDTTLFENENNVRINNLRNTVRNDDDRSIFLYRVEAVFDLFGGNRVEARRRFIEKNNRRVFQKKARDSDALLLSAGKLLRFGLIFIRQLFNLVV
jgi:hypothetical protein